MNRCLKQSSLAILSLLLVVSASQGQISQILQPNNQKSIQPVAPDPLGRETPNGSLFGFLQAVQAENYPTAAQYLQMSPARRAALGEQIATKLKAVLDTAFVGSLRAISTNPEGSPQPGIAPDHERVGTLSVDDSEVDVIMVHVTDPNAGKIWLFSAETLSRIPELYEQVEAHQVESHVPKVLVQTHFLGMSVWLWLALLIAVPVAAVLGWILIELVVFPLMWWRGIRKQPQLADWRKVSGPVWLVLGVMIHRILVSFLGMPLLHRHYYFLTARVILITGLAWLALRALSRGMGRLRDRAIARGSTGTGSLVLLGQRVAKALIVIAAGLAVLGVLGFNLTTALAGL